MSSLMFACLKRAAMTQILTDILLQCWLILEEAAPYVLIGFGVAGLLKGLLPDRFIARHIGDNTIGSVVKASLLGIPLPLCSCGVIPAAIELRKQGASRGASAAFLVSTPESGVDSIAITYALLDPVMTVIRPIAAFLTATATGVAVNFLPEEKKEEVAPVVPGCGCPPEINLELVPASMPSRVAGGLRYAFGELLQDIGGWLLLGIAIAGLVSYLVPDSFFSRFLSDEFSSLVIMLLVGIPLYICASASTPVAAALILKGVSPGAALVFLLAGPATNAATITLVNRFWGRKATVIYLTTISICSLIFGWVTNRLYGYFGWDIIGSVKSVVTQESSLLSSLMAVMLLALILKSFFFSFLQRKKPCSGTGVEPDR